MRSIAHAMLWELFRKSRWSLLPFLTLAIALWIMPLATISSESLHSSNAEFVLFHFVFSLISILCIIAGVMIFQSPVSRFFTYPISTATLVAWKLLLPSALVGCVVASAFAAANFIYSIELPILGVSLFAVAVSAPLVLLSIQSSSQSLWTLGLEVAIMIGLVYWWKSRYGEPFSNPTHLWTEVTLSEYATLIGAMALTYGIGFRKVAADRCGKEALSGPIKSILNRCRSVFVSRSTAGQPAFRSPAQAQFWYEFQQKRAAFPAITALIVCMLVVPYPIHLAIQGFYGNVTIPDGPTIIQGIYQGLVAFGFAFSIFGIFAGGYIGISEFNGGKGDREPSFSDWMNRNELIRMGPFQATLPILPIHYSVAILRTIVQSFFTTWIVWLILIVCLLLVTRQGTTNGIAHDDFDPASLGYWWLPLTLLGPWIVMANMASILLTGRNRVVLALFTTASVMFLGSVIGIGQIHSPRLAEFASVACVDLLSVTLVIGTVYAFALAATRKLINFQCLLSGVAMSAAIAVAAIFSAPFTLFPSAYLMILAFAALVVLPVASVPLAIAWNRHR